MHFLRCDVAGNISKKYSASGLRFPDTPGSCPKWAAHLAFLTPSVITRLYSQMPDGTTYFCFAFAERLQRTLGATGLAVVMRLSAFILMCIGVQIMWNGIDASFGLTKPHS